jgi:hypothetical protein
MWLQPGAWLNAVPLAARKSYDVVHVVGLVVRLPRRRPHHHESRQPGEEKDDTDENSTRSQQFDSSLKQPMLL